MKKKESIKVGYVEPIDYISKEARKKYKFCELLKAINKMMIFKKC